MESKIDRVTSATKRRLARALIWPVLLLQYDLNSDRTLGGYKAKWLLRANRKLDAYLRRRSRRRA